MKNILVNDRVRVKEKYSRGRRGAPAKGVGRATGARVQIPLSPFHLPEAREALETVLLFYFIGFCFSVTQPEGIYCLSGYILAGEKTE